MRGNHNEYLDQEVHAAAGGPLPERLLTGRTLEPTEIEAVVFLSAVTAAISFAITEAKLSRPLREWAKARSFFWGELFCCGYCFGHWVAAVLVLAYRPRLFVWWWPVDYLFTALVIAWLSAFQWAALCLLMEKAGK